MDSPAGAARRCGRLPKRRTGDPGDVDAVEQHRELGRIERGSADARCDWWDPEFSFLQTFVDQKKTPAVPHQNLRAVRLLADEREQMAAERVQVPTLDDREQPVVAATHVHAL